MKIIYSIVLLLLALLAPVSAVFGQDLVVTGKVTDAQGEPLIGANVTQRGTTLLFTTTR